jgi:16S rRNA (uracil1498-N3)-methyltransferase
MMRPRFLAPDVTIDTRVAILSKEESDHAYRVLRLGPGDELGLFDGRGAEYVARVASVDRGRVTVSILERVEAIPEMTPRVTIAQAVLKSEAMDEVVRDAVMLGAASIQLVTSTHVEAHARVSPRRLERWTRIAVASAKQCRRAVVPIVHPPASLDGWLASDRAPCRLMLVEPARARSARRLRDALPREPPESLSILIGPEGGWAPDEIDRAAASGVVLATLGARTLRAERAALVALSVVQFLWERE